MTDQDYRDDLRFLLGGIYDQLKSVGHPVCGRMQSGVDSDCFDKYESEIEWLLSSELKFAYTIYNGTHSVAGDNLNKIRIFPGYRWLPLEDAVQTYRFLVQLADWDFRWFPIFASDSGDYYFQLLSKEQKSQMPMGDYLRGEEEHPLSFVCLTAFFETFLRTFEIGGISCEEDFFLDMDYDLQEKIRIKINKALAPELFE